MSKVGQKKTQAKKVAPEISEPLDFKHIASGNHVQHLSKANRQAESVNIWPQPLHSPQGIPPTPCPGPSIVQNIGTISLNPSEMDKLVSQVTEAVKQELRPILDAIQQLKDHKPDSQYRYCSCQNPYEREKNWNFDTDSSVYVNHIDIDPTVGDKSTPTSRSVEDIAQPVFNPMYDTHQMHVSSPPLWWPIMGKKPPVPQPRSRQPPCFEFRQHPGRKYPAIKRDCYAKAIQTYIHEIVEGVIFTGSSLPDDLITEECLTETECRTIREKSDLKDQLRHLVVTIKTRDLQVMMKFLDCLEKQSPQIVQNIRQSCDDYIKKGFRERKCLMCRLKCNINIKNVADHLYASDFIGDEMYNEIICFDKPTGVQDLVWEKLLETLTQNGCSRPAFETIEHFLQNKGHYKYLADDIHRMLNKTGERFECACKIHVRLSAAISSTESLSSKSPASSGSSYGPSSEELLSGECTRNYAANRNFWIRKEGFSAFTQECNEKQKSEKTQQDKKEEQQEDKEEKEKVLIEPTSAVENKEHGVVRNVNACSDQPPPPLPKKKQASTDLSDPHSSYV